MRHRNDLASGSRLRAPIGTGAVAPVPVAGAAPRISLGYWLAALAAGTMIWTLVIAAF